MSNQFDPSFWLNQLCVSSRFYSPFRQVFLGSQARKEFLGSRGSRGQSLNWRFYFLLFFLSLFSLRSRTECKAILWFCEINRSSSMSWMGGTQDGGESSAITGQVRFLGILSPDLPVPGGYHPADTTARLELDGGGVTWPACAGTLEAGKEGNVLLTVYPILTLEGQTKGNL